MMLTNLPNELLMTLPQHLHNIEDFMNASSSCRKLRDAFARTTPNTILQLAAAQSRVFFRPDPYFLVAATAPEVGQWGLQSTENTEVVRAAFRNGIEGLFELCVSVAGLTMGDVRRLHLSRFKIVNPVEDMIDRMAGKQWYETPNFWDGGVSDAYTIDCEPMRTTFQLAIYGELFGSSMNAFLQPSLSLPRYSLDARLDYIRYCVPDWITHQGSPGLGAPDPTGPYVDKDFGCGDGLALHHVVHTGRWRRPWERIRLQIGPDFEEEWRQEMWEEAAQLHGLAGFEMLVKTEFLENWRGKLHEIRTQIEQLDPKNRPKESKFGRLENVAYDCPMISKEIHVCIAGYWQFHG
jgi:hypothetical protein